MRSLEERGEDNYIEWDWKNTGKVDHNFIGGGQSNEILNIVDPTGPDGDEPIVPHVHHNTIGGGEGNRIMTIDPDFLADEWGWSFIGGGRSNIIDAQEGAIGGGVNNTIRSKWQSDHAEGQPGAVNKRADYSFIGGGEQNLIGAGNSIIFGFSGSDGGAHSVISGGFNNTITNDNSAIAGGDRLKLGKNSFGFNGAKTEVTGITDLTATISAAPFMSLQPSTDGAGTQKNIAYFGNVDLMLGDVDK